MRRPIRRGAARRAHRRAPGSEGGRSWGIAHAGSGRELHARDFSDEGYGAADPKLVQWYPRSVLDHGYDLKEGSMVMWQSADGLAAKPASIVDATEDAVKIDLNHPYAGKTLEYWVELVGLQ